MAAAVGVVVMVLAAVAVVVFAIAAASDTGEALFHKACSLVTQ